MAVCLSILKIIGIVVACIIALILLFTAAVLFVPVRYKGSFDKEEKNAAFNIKGNISFLLHILSAHLLYESDSQKGLYWDFKILGIKVKKSADDKTAETSDENAADNTDFAKEKDNTDFAACKAQNGKAAYSVDWNNDEAEDDLSEIKAEKEDARAKESPEDVEIKEDTQTTPDTIILEDTSDTKDREAGSFKEDSKEKTDDSAKEFLKEDDFNKENKNAQKESKAKEDKKSGSDESILERTIDSLKRKSKKFKSFYNKKQKSFRYLKKMLNDEQNKSAADFIYKGLIKAIKHYIPKKCTGQINFGFEDPASTGRVLMYLGLIYPLIPRKLIINPGYEESYFYGNIKFSGRIRVIHIAVYALKLLLRKDTRRLWRLYKKRP